MYEALWIALGAALGAVVALAAHRAGRTRTDAVAAPPRARRVETRVTPETRELALSMADELASLVSAVEARTHHLIEAAPTRSALPDAADATLASVRRLRKLHAKLVAVGGARVAAGGVTDIRALLDGLGDELQHLQLGLELRWDPPETMPSVDANPDAARDAMLFVCAALLRAERGATRLTISTEWSFSRDRPTIKIEFDLEWVTKPQDHGARDEPERGFALDWEAAKALVLSQGGELTLSHLPGKAVHAVVRYPVTEMEMEVGDEAAHAPEQAPAAGDALGQSEHAYGGALVIESDPALRGVLARELKATGRAVFVCADGESAHTFLKTTPDRFELLIVDDAQELLGHTPLARTIRSHAPALKICLLATTPSEHAAAWDGLHTLQKPFGVHQLRRTLANILAEH